jgi:hypothetical protein
MPCWQAITRADLDRALAELERTEGIPVRSIVGINHDAVFGSTRERWHPDLPDACKEPFVPLLSKSTSCSAACPQAAAPGSSGTARCPTDISILTPPRLRARRRSLRT